MATIYIKDLSITTIIGINDWERKEKQEIILNICLDFDARKAAKTDDISHTIDYKALKNDIISMVRESKYYLLEKLVEEVLTLIMQDPKVQKATVRIDKPKALRFAKSVAIESSRKRKSS